MKQNKQIKKITTATILTLVVSVTFASFTLSGTVDEKAKNNKYSLKNINHFSNKSFSLSLLKTTLQNRGTTFISPKSNNVSSEYNSFIQMDKGNTTYIMPYNFKVKTPKFKTPSPNN